MDVKKIITILLALFTVIAFGADLTGNWKGTAHFGDNTIERTFTFKVDGKKLTGETSSEMMGKSVINDGVIDGDDLSFTITGIWRILSLPQSSTSLHHKPSPICLPGETKSIT